MALFYQRRSKDFVVKTRPGITRCERHPKHQQLLGVCSLCLQEKLSKLSSGSSSSSSSSFSSGARFRRQYCYYSSGSSSSSSSSLSSSSGSSMASPVHQYRFDGNDVLVKSRSIAFVPRRNGNDDNKRIGFWSRLLKPGQREG